MTLGADLGSRSTLPNADALNPRPAGYDARS